MKHLYPTYYHLFRCIAADCPDSCCQGWDVVIDAETEAFYNTVKGAFGERLRASVYTDGDGDRVFRLAEGKKCPYWGEDRLCEIYKTLGEEHLCLTCARFPRLSMDYGDFTEHSLALACPEAARLILNADDAYVGFDDADTDDPTMRLLLRARREAAGILAQDRPLGDRFDELARRANGWQNALTGERFDRITPFRAEQYAQLEYIDERNRDRIVRAAAYPADFSRHERELTRLALYYLYRYFLGAIDTLDMIAPIRFLITSVGVIDNLSRGGDLTSAAQTYSKEVEQSYENMELFL